MEKHIQRCHKKKPGCCAGEIFWSDETRPKWSYTDIGKN